MMITKDDNKDNNKQKNATNQSHAKDFKMA